MVKDDNAVDVSLCGGTQLPDERTVVTTDDRCYASVSVINATTKMDVSAGVQGDIFSHFPKDFFSCYNATV